MVSLTGLAFDTDIVLGSDAGSDIDVNGNSFAVEVQLLYTFLELYDMLQVVSDSDSARILQGRHVGFTGRLS